MTRKQGLLVLGTLLALVAVVLLAVRTGAVRIPLPAFFSMLGIGSGEHTARQEALLMVVRLPRILLGILAGAALAVGGAAMQALFRNPLADPSIIGISSGAGAMAALAITAGASITALFGTFAATAALPIMAFAGALVSALVVFSIAREGRRTSVAAMLLAGIGITAITGAFTGLLTFGASDTQLRSITFWMLGSLAGANRTAVIVLLCAVPLPIFLVLSAHRQLNALALGEQQARYLGVDPERLKWRIVICTAIMVGATVAFTGVIGFVGLVVPHIYRMAGGADNRYLLPAAMLGGATLLCAADVVARTVVAPAELPIGIITSLCGAPFFLALLMKRKRAFVA